MHPVPQPFHTTSSTLSPPSSPILNQTERGLSAVAAEKVTRTPVLPLLPTTVVLLLICRHSHARSVGCAPASRLRCAGSTAPAPVSIGDVRRTALPDAFALDSVTSSGIQCSVLFFCIFPTTLLKCPTCSSAYLPAPWSTKSGESSISEPLNQP